MLSSGVISSHAHVCCVQAQPRRAAAADGCLPMFEALARTTNARDPATYRRAVSHERAVALILERGGRMYDPEIVQGFIPIVERLHAQERTVLTPRFPALVRAGWLTQARAAV